MTNNKFPGLSDDYNWEHIFNTYTTNPNHVRTGETIQKSFGFDNIKSVIAKYDGQNDEAPWVGLFETNYGQFLTVRASCDYTGWGCQEGGNCNIADTIEDAITFGLSLEERNMLRDQFPEVNHD